MSHFLGASQAWPRRSSPAVKGANFILGTIASALIIWSTSIYYPALAVSSAVLRANAWYLRRQSLATYQLVVSGTTGRCAFVGNLGSTQKTCSRFVYTR